MTIKLHAEKRMRSEMLNAFRMKFLVCTMCKCIYMLCMYMTDFCTISHFQNLNQKAKTKISAFIYGNFEGLFYRNVNDFRTTNAYLFMHYVDKALIWSVNEFFKFLIALRTHSIFVFVAGNMSIFELCTNKMNR